MTKNDPINLTSAKEIALSKPVENFFGKRVGRVFLREPRASHLQRFGEPRTAVFHPEAGTRYLVDRDDAIGRYLDELLSLDGHESIDVGGASLLTHLTLSDGIALREALFDFFSQAREALSSRQKASA
jgi:hypothetical protein